MNSKVQVLLDKINIDKDNADSIGELLDILSKKLNQYETELKKLGIEFSKKRTGERREVLLTYTMPMTV